MRNFPQKNWTPGVLDNLLERIHETSEVDRKKGSRCKKEQWTEESVPLVQLILSQEIQSGTHNRKREIADLTDIPSLLWIEKPIWIWTCKASKR